MIALDTNLLVYAHRGDMPEHDAALRVVVEKGRVMGGVTHDARIAAMCLDHGVRELLITDRDCTRFPTLRVRNPLV